MMGFIMYVAPLGAFGAMAFTIGKLRNQRRLCNLASLMVCFYATAVLFVFIVLGAIARLHGFRI